MQKALVLIVKSYKKYFSPLLFLLGLGGCRFYPACSEYSLVAVKKYGVFRGLVLTFKRVIRCQPLGGFGLDNP